MKLHRKESYIGAALEKDYWSDKPREFSISEAMDAIAGDSHIESRLAQLECWVAVLLEALPEDKVLEALNKRNHGPDFVLVDN